MNTKLFYKISLGVLLVLLGIVGYFAYQRTYVAQTDTSTTAPILNNDDIDENILGYRNNLYGFFVPLPESWQGYTVNQQAKGTYLEIHIVHPQSTTQNERMDVPVLVVPIAVWNIWYPPSDPNSGQHPFAAPVPATERARNGAYVFATAPRYNFSYLPGWEEVDEIVKKITAFTPVSSQNPTINPNSAPLFEEGEVKG